ncbi:MAG: hypothetical protein E6F99_00275 [Actinobacteria bacterium]|nr:MAG: hypothetical protein E6F99_00275 [Actinomycetota bacterium]
MQLALGNPPHRLLVRPGVFGPADDEADGLADGEADGLGDADPPGADMSGAGGGSAQDAVRCSFGELKTIAAAVATAMTRTADPTTTVSVRILFGRSRPPAMSGTIHQLNEAPDSQKFDC